MRDCIRNALQDGVEFRLMGIHVHKPTGSLLLHVADPFGIRELLGSASKTLVHPIYNIAVRHTNETVRVLGNLGHAVPLPPADMLSNYRWPGKYKPMSHQREMVTFHLAHKRCFNLSEMGTAKTAAALWAADILMTSKVVRKVLILSPLSTLERVWLQEIFDVLMHRQAGIVHGSREKRLKVLQSNLDFYILNHDGVSIRDVANAIRKRDDIDLVIVDEGAMFRNPGTDRYKDLVKMLKPEQRIWWLTGTPVPNAPTDAWAQARIINPAAVPQFFGTFQRNVMVQFSQFKWAPRAGSEKMAFAALQPAIRFAKQDCIDLPPVVTINLQAQLTDEQKVKFRNMRNHMHAEMQTRQITAVNAADKVGKLRQILCGACRDSEKEDYVILPHEPRFNTMLDAVRGAHGKAIVIVPFKGIIQSLDHELSKHYTVGVLNGDVTINARNKIITDFKTTPDPHVLLCHPRVMAHGLNLTEADVIVFYAPIYSNDEFQQVIERFNRVGQTRKMTIVRIAAHPLEWQIYNLVDTKRITQETVLDLYRSVAI